MTATPDPTFIVYDPAARLADGLAAERCVLLPEDRETLSAGTVTIDADECYAVADGHGKFLASGLTGTFPASESVILPAYVIAGPGLPLLIPGGGKTLDSQDEADQIRYQFQALDARGALFVWEPMDDLYEHFAWETAGEVGPAAPAFPVTAWR